MQKIIELDNIYFGLKSMKENLLILKDLKIEGQSKQSSLEWNTQCWDTIFNLNLMMEKTLSLRDEISGKV